MLFGESFSVCNAVGIRFSDIRGRSVMADTTPMLRQWMLLRILGARRYGVTLREMAEETGVSQKTIGRDLKLLQQVGFQVSKLVSDHGRKHWKLQAANGSAEFSFNLTEVVSLYLGRRFLEPLAGTYFWDGAQSAFRKIRASLGEEPLRYLEKLATLFHQTNVGGGDYSKQAELIDALMVAIEDRKVAYVAYQSMRNTESVTYDIHPYGFVFHRGSLYLIAFAPEHQEVRHYKIDRIGSVDVQKLLFPKPADFDLGKHLADSFGVYRGDGEGVRIRVKFLPPVARYVEESRWHPSQQLKKQKDGSLLAEFELADTDEIKRWIFSFGRNAVVLEPKELREAIVGELCEMIGQYEAASPRSRREKQT